jgi:putative phosphoesterase
MGGKARRRVRVGVISDTHGLLRPEAVAALRGSALILHAGDVGDPAILTALAALAPIHAVRGNNDQDAWAASLPLLAEISAAGRRLWLVHDLSELAQLGGDPAAQQVDVVVAGHSHRPKVERRGSVLYFNPGSAGPRRFTLPIAVGALELSPGASIRAEIIELLAPARR